MTALNKACEESLVDYLISTVDTSSFADGTVINYYTGIGNVSTLTAPAVFVCADSGHSVYHNSNVYELMVKVSVKEMAADTNSGSLGILAHRVFNSFWDPNRVGKINSGSMTNWNFACWHVEQLDLAHSTLEDAMINEMLVKVVGTLSGSNS